jgi:RimJ/RimL family protein N-acetyltransferase
MTESGAPTAPAVPRELFFRRIVDARPDEPVLPPGCGVRLWRPRGLALPPAPLRTVTTAVWWLFHVARIFASRDFTVVLIERHGRIVHRSSVFPRFFRFPFMRSDDLQVGATWTHPSERGRGLAGLAIQYAMAELWRPGRAFWYLVEESNVASVRVIEKQGFQYLGAGRKRPRAGLLQLGYYDITEKAPPDGAILP